MQSSKIFDTRAVWAAIPFTLLAGVLLYYVTRDTWESDNWVAIREIADKADRGFLKGDDVQVIDSCQKLFRLVGDHQLKDDYLREKVQSFHEKFKKSTERLAERDRKRLQTIEQVKADQLRQSEMALAEKRKEDDDRRRKEQEKVTLDEQARQVEEKAEKAARLEEEQLIRLRDERLRAKCTAVVAPHTNEIAVGDGILSISGGPHLLYVLTGVIYNSKHILEKPGVPRLDPFESASRQGNDALVKPGPKEKAERWYPAGDSTLRIGVNYNKKADGSAINGVDGWYDVSGKPTKLKVTCTDPTVLKQSEAVPTFFDPVQAGETVVTVSMAGKSLSASVIVVPLPIAKNESTDSVISRLGLPDATRLVSVTWPNSGSFDGIFYIDNLRTDGSNSAVHWRFKKYPGAVIATRDGKVINVSTQHSMYDYEQREK